MFATRATKITELLERFGIGHLKNKPMSRLSSGETTRVGLCKAFLNDPELLLLDEPTAYLDPAGGDASARGSARSPAKPWHNYPLYLAQHARGPAHVRPDSLSRAREASSRPAPRFEVTREILKEDRDAPALDEVFIRIAGRQPDEAAIELKPSFCGTPMKCVATGITSPTWCTGRW